MAAHHQEHWCAVAIDTTKKVVLYLDSCPAASSDQMKVEHRVKIQELCMIVDGSSMWTFHHMTNEDVARYLNIPVLPTQHTLVDCGVFVVFTSGYVSANLWMMVGYDSEHRAVVHH